MYVFISNRFSYVCINKQGPETSTSHNDYLSQNKLFNLKNGLIYWIRQPNWLVNSD